MLLGCWSVLQKSETRACFEGYLNSVKLGCCIIRIHFNYFSFHLLNVLINPLPQVLLISTNTAVPHITILMLTKAKLIPSCYPTTWIRRQSSYPLYYCHTHIAQEGADDKRMKWDDGSPAHVPRVLLWQRVLNGGSANNFFLQLQQFRLWLHMLNLPGLTHTHEISCSIWNIFPWQLLKKLWSRICMRQHAW